jgi:hypothetical protein
VTKEASRIVAHLLHNIDDASELAENALVQELWPDLAAEGLDFAEAIERVRSIALAAIDDLDTRFSDSAARSATIVRACDLEGKSPDLVAAGLGISTRTLRRGRVAALTFIRDEIISRIAQGDDDLRIPTEPVEIRVRTAFLLALAGRLEEAVHYLVPLLDQFSGLDKVSVACALAELRVEAGLILEARMYLQHAIDATELLDGDVRQLALARIAFVRSQIADTAGAPASSSDDPLDEHRAWLAHDAPKRGLSNPDLLEALVASGVVHRLRRGDPDAATSLFRAHKTDDRRSHVSLLTRANYLVVAVDLALHCGDDIAADCERLYRFARSIASPVASAFALISRARLATARGDHEAAEVYAREAVFFASSCESRVHQAVIAIGAARTAVHGKRPLEGIALARDARKLAPAGSYLASLAVLREVEALHGAGQLRRSLRLSDACKAQSSVQNYPHVLGQFFRVDAENFHAIGDDLRARHALARSIDIFRETGYQVPLAQSLELAKRALPAKK